MSRGMLLALRHQVDLPTVYLPLPTLARTYHSRKKPRPGSDETSIASAKHKPSLSGPSLGHLLTELSATTPDMLKSGLRQEGHTMDEEHRTVARKVTLGVLGLPLAFGSVVVGVAWLWPSPAERDG